MLMKKALNNTGWHLPTWNGSACCGSVRQCADRPSPVLISTITLSILSILSCLSKQADFGDVTGMEALTEEDRWLLPPFRFFQLHRQVWFDVGFSRHVVRRCVSRERFVRVYARVAMALQPDSACFWRLCD